MKTLETYKFTTKSGLIGIVKHFAFDIPENTEISINTNWFCGYVLIPENHPYVGKTWNDYLLLNVHGGITFNDYAENFEPTANIDGYVFGFDCNHCNDDPEIQDREYTINEVENLARQLSEINKLAVSRFSRTS
jgi:hypothetical protein